MSKILCSQLLAVSHCPELFTSERDVSGFSLSCYRFWVHFHLYHVVVMCSICHRNFFIVNEYEIRNLLMALLHDQKSLIWCLQMIVQYNNFLLLIYKNVGSCHTSFT